MAGSTHAKSSRELFQAPIVDPSGVQGLVMLRILLQCVEHISHDHRSQIMVNG
jgi:hypothetical protein